MQAAVLSLGLILFACVSAQGATEAELQAKLSNPRSTLRERVEAAKELLGLEASLEEAAKSKEGPFGRGILPFYRSTEIPLADKIALFLDEGFQDDLKPILEGDWQKYPCSFVTFAEILRRLYTDPGLSDEQAEALRLPLSTYGTTSYKFFYWGSWNGPEFTLAQESQLRRETLETLRGMPKKLRADYLERLEDLYRQSSMGSHGRTWLVNINREKEAEDLKSFHQELVVSVAIAAELLQFVGEYPADAMGWTAFDLLGQVIARAARASVAHPSAELDAALNPLAEKLTRLLKKIGQEITRLQQDLVAKGCTDPEPKDWDFTPKPASYAAGVNGILEYLLAKNRAEALAFIDGMQALPALRDDYDPLAHFRYLLYDTLQRANEKAIPKFLTTEIQRILKLSPEDKGKKRNDKFLVYYIRDLSKIAPEEAMGFLEQSLDSHPFFWVQGGDSTDYFGDTAVTLLPKFPDRVRKAFDRMLDLVGNRVSEYQFVNYCRVAPTTAFSKLPQFVSHVMGDHGYLGWTNLAGNNHLDMPIQFRVWLIQQVATEMERDSIYRDDMQTKLQKLRDDATNVALRTAMATDPLGRCLAALLGSPLAE